MKTKARAQMSDGTKGGIRNFICPLTETACTDTRCVKDRCAERIDDQARQMEAEKRNFARRLRHGLVGLDEFGI
jgi:hypothetical protein